MASQLKQHTVHLLPMVVTSFICAQHRGLA